MALRIGISPSDFWSLTPHELYECHSVWVESQESNQDLTKDKLALAWSIEAMRRQKRLQPLDRYLKSTPKPRRWKPEEKGKEKAEHERRVREMTGGN